MFFVLSKTVALLLLPSNFLIALTLAGAALTATRWRRAGFRLAAGGLALLVVIGFLPVGNFLAYALENRFPPWDPSRGAPDGIIVLGGSISPEISLAHGEPAVPAGAERIIALARLARQFPAARIVYAGGNGNLVGGVPEADFVYPLLDRLGVARERVVLERRSRNTAENAAFSKALIDPKPGERWLLVTSAQHMPRAVGCFRRIGFPVQAYPVDWQVATAFDLERSFALGLNRADQAVHEWLGLIVYRASGRTSELLPGPAGL